MQFENAPRLANGDRQGYFIGKLAISLFQASFAHLQYTGTLACIQFDSRNMKDFTKHGDTVTWCLLQVSRMDQSVPLTCSCSESQTQVVSIYIFGCSSVFAIGDVLQQYSQTKKPVMIEALNEVVYYSR